MWAEPFYVDLADEIDVLQTWLLDQEVLQHLVRVRARARARLWSAYVGEM